MRVLSCLYETYFLTGNSPLNDDKLSNVYREGGKKKVKQRKYRTSARLMPFNVYSRLYDGTLLLHSFSFMEMRCESPALL